MYRITGSIDTESQEVNLAKIWETEVVEDIRPTFLEHLAIFSMQVVDIMEYQLLE